MSRGPRQNQPANSADIWREFVAEQQKSNSKLGKVLAAAIYGDYENRILTLYFADDAARKAAQGQTEPLKNKLKSRLLCDRIDFRVDIGTPPPPPPAGRQVCSDRSLPARNIGNPLQALNFTPFGRDRQGKELTQPVLQAAADAETDCADIYAKLNQRTFELAGGENHTLKVSFNWRMRVGGTRGFRELLLPALHPVFGIPYIPASSLKGAAKAWADAHHSDKGKIQELLGLLEQKKAQAAKVEFLDAFPTKPCLRVDVATPQWHWKQNQQIVYKPEPHPLLNLEQPQFFIGLCPTARGNSDDVKVVKGWLENALKTGGIGSRISSGYGRTVTQEAHLPHSQSFNFELWTQGMYGSNPQAPEFRPTAVRGIIRYWFRAVALGLYDAATCLTLEEKLFGKLGQQGTISISIRTNPSQRQKPYLYTGRIILEATEEQHLRLVERSLILASHLGGVGRGSRRPLHLLDVSGRRDLRGCHWLVEGNNLPLAYDEQQWQTFFNSVSAAFKVVQPSTKTYTSSPGKPEQRQQDVLDRNAQVWLLKTSELVNLENVKNWQTEGDHLNVRGTALNLLYGDTRFKGGSQGQGNANVGGKLGTPSFVWIKSLFPALGSPYQVVTIFGSDYSERLTFAKELQTQGAILVYGQSSGSVKRPLPKRK